MSTIGGPGIVRSIPVLHINTDRKTVTVRKIFTFDTTKEAEYAEQMGQWLISPSTNHPSGYVLNFFPSDNHKLTYPIDGTTIGGTNCRSFLPYISLLPNTRRKNSLAQYDFRKLAFKNSFKRRCKLDDYRRAQPVVQPKTKQLTIPFELVNISKAPDSTPKVVEHHHKVDKSIARTTVLAVMNVLGLTRYEAVDLILDLDNKKGS